MKFTMPPKFLSTAAVVDVRVRNEDGNESNSLLFRVKNGPLITRKSRTHLKSGRGPTELKIGGVSFEQGVLLFVNEAAVDTRFLSDSELIATIPAGLTQAVGTLTLQARNLNGGRSNTVMIRVVP